MAALLHSAELTVQSALGGFRWFSRDFLWMSFVAYGIVALGGVVPIALLAGASRSRFWLAFAAAFGVAFAVFGVLLPYPQIARYAALLVALGVALEVGYLVARAPVAWARRAAYAAATFLLLAPATIVLQSVFRRGAESAALPALPQARPDAPNVLLVVLDAVRAKSFGLTNPAVTTTPNLTRWAETGAVFDRAFTVAPWTLPSHASMFTGHYSADLSADWTVPLDKTHPVLAESFRDAGYATGAFVANLHYAAYDSGLERGFIHYNDYETNWRQILASSSYTQTNLFDRLMTASPREAVAALRHPDLSILRQHRYHARLGEEVADAYLAWQAANSTRPTFAFVNVMDAHLLHSAPLQTRRRYPPFERGEDDYLASIRYLDAQVDRILTTLAQRGALDRTIVIVTADHGELLGEHGLTGHARSLYKDVLHVPLLVRYPVSVPGGARVGRAVSLRDLAATIIDLAGVERRGIPGVSLANAWRDSSVALSPVLGEVRQQPSPVGDYPTAKGALKALATADSFYVVNDGTGVDELFAYTASEVVAVARGDTAQALLEPWRARLARMLGVARTVVRR